MNTFQKYYLLLLILYGLSCISFAQSLNFAFNTIYDIKNPGFNEDGLGHVDYIYEMSVYEVTNEQYCAFLNNLGADVIKYNLYNNLMGQHFFGGILFDKTTNTYFCKKGYENKPVVGVTWMSSARFLNWLHYNSANIERKNPVSEFLPLTEGNSDFGAYDTRSVPKCRNKNAKYWLPNKNEWVKACFFNGKEYIQDCDKLANVYTQNKGWAYPYPHINDVGCSSPQNCYGLYDMMGNAAEWIEDNRGAWKYAYGGSVIRNKNYTRINNPEADDPNKAITTFGIRLCRTTNIKDRNVDQEISISMFNNSFSKEKSIDILYDVNGGGKYVLVEDVGNEEDPLYHRGKVNYKYFISRYELSNIEYCNFLNSVARKGDPFKLYDRNMSSSACGGIVRKVIGKTNVYQVKRNYANRPVVYIGFYELARYANWLHYGCPNKGVSVLGTTEGTEVSGAYDTRYFEDVRSGKLAPWKDFGKRNVGAKYWIPNDDEWYKAAYYDPSKIGLRKYHDYPTRSDNAPLLSECNYMVDNTLSLGEPFFVANVDSFTNCPSYYGTIQQGGNVWEWIEDWSYEGIGHRGLRGGSWSYTEYGLNAVNIDDGGIDGKLYVFGGRLCRCYDNEGYLFTPPVKKIINLSVFLKYSYFILSCICIVFTFYIVINKYYVKK